MNKQSLRVQVIEQSKKVVCPFPNISEELKEAYCLARVIDAFLIQKFFPTQKVLTENQKLHQVDSILNAFEKDIIWSLETAKKDFVTLRKNPRKLKQNLFIYAGTKQLYLSNKYTRTISTKLGNYLEKIINIDKSRCFDTEAYLQIKIKGVDKFILDNQNIRHVQIKTKKDTLTGSQAKRSVIELSIHPNPVFAAVFDFGKGWHFPKIDGVQRLTGQEFWDLIGFDYEVILEKICQSLRRIENELF